MGKFSRNKLKYSVDESFFNTWTNQMAYVLGFTYADGNIHRTSLSWDVQLKDKNVLYKITNSLKSNYPIKLQRKVSYRLRINNQNLIQGAIRLGLLPKKSIRNSLPKIPISLVRHFIRGFIDGDGWLTLRQNRNEFDIGFCGGNRWFIHDVNSIICKNLNMSQNNVRKRVKITRKQIKSTTYMVEYFSSKAMRIATWLYDNLENNDLYLDRKHKTYNEARQLYNYLWSGTKKARVIQKKFGVPLKSLLQELYINKHFDGVRIASYLGIHSSSAYRWLEQTRIRPVNKRYE